MFIIKDWKKEVFTLPNLLSIFRLLLIPVYVSIYLHAGEDVFLHILAAGVLTVSCLTDLLDGQIARRFHMVSALGKVLDPLADKLTQLTLTLIISLRYPPLRGMLVLLTVKELFQLTAGIIFLSQGKMLSGALAAGKVCTAVLFVSLIVMVTLPSVPDSWVHAIAVTDSVFLAVSLVGYIIAYFGKDPRLQDVSAQ